MAFKSVDRTRRLFEILATVRRYGLGELAGDAAPRWLVGAKKDHDAPVAERLRLALEELGPVFIKFGQMLSTRRDLLPPGMAEELSRLQDDVPPFKGAKARELIEAAYGHSLDQFFAEFDEEPMAAASIAQVHAARLHAQGNDQDDETEGAEVVVKVLRPDVHERVVRDVAVMYWLAGLAARFHPEAERLRPVELARGLVIDRHPLGTLCDFHVAIAGFGGFHHGGGVFSGLQASGPHENDRVVDFIVLKPTERLLIFGKNAQGTGLAAVQKVQILIGLGGVVAGFRGRFLVTHRGHHGGRGEARSGKDVQRINRRRIPRCRAVHPTCKRIHP